MGGGPPGFPPDFTCPMVLWILTANSRFHIRDFHPLRSAFPKQFYYPLLMLYSVRNPKGIATSGLACFPFARRYSENRFFFLFLRLLRCFSSAGSLHMTILFTIRCQSIALTGFPIRKSAGQWIFAPIRSLSQLVTSFFGS